jgi:hypothetical protein
MISPCCFSQQVVARQRPICLSFPMCSKSVLPVVSMESRLFYLETFVSLFSLLRLLSSGASTVKMEAERFSKLISFSVDNTALGPRGEESS